MFNQNLLLLSESKLSFYPHLISSSVFKSGRPMRMSNCLSLIMNYEVGKFLMDMIKKPVDGWMGRWTGGLKAVSRIAPKQNNVLDSK